MVQAKAATRYTYDTWSLELPADWEAEETDECVLFYNSRDELGAFQISSYFKEGEQQISAAELIDFVGDVAYQAVVLPYMEGLFYRQDDSEYSVWHWCLRSGTELILVTYSCEKQHIEVEEQAREHILNTLRSWH